ncbi:hypothetical protein [Cellulosimicrobium sp. CUA-896]|uniref:hypothetical protein n=1 Tax=Cellulosimicrobium sp. CUA-896 TaxID=1517881 RepID=UPI00096603BB|nr:hypothetical protein [Cellulosimicrobium sp. CUA-896]OLT55303.1 hypothetical protein BJF88_06580 [Cellulosimicrobium sp. CUA-896]
MSPAAGAVPLLGGQLDASTGAGGPGWAADVVAETATPAPSPSEDPLRPELEPTDVSPGLAGFLAIFAVALAAVALFFGLSRQLRRMRRNAEDRGIPVEDRRGARRPGGAGPADDAGPAGDAPGDADPGEGTSTGRGR